jgi:hypothetical protein
MLGLKQDIGIDAVMDIMPNMLKVKESGKIMVESALRSFKKFAEARTAEGFAQWFPKQKDGDNTNPLRDIKIGGVALENLWEIEPKELTDPAYKVLKDGVRATVKTAMNLASAVTLKEMIDMRVTTNDLMNDIVDNGFTTLWGEFDDELNIRVGKTAVKKAVRGGKYVPEAVFRANAGRLLLRELELKLSKKLTVQQRPDIEMALGVLVINNILPKRAKDVDTVRRGVVFVKNDKLVYEHIAVKDEDVSKSKSIRVMNLETLSKDYMREVGEMGTVFEFATAREEGDISLTPIAKKKADATIRNSDVPLATPAKNYLDRQGEQSWEFVGLEEYIHAAQNMSTTEDGSDYVEIIKEQLLGSLEELIASTQAMDMESKLAKYKAEELIIERMLQAHALVGDGQKFYLGWDYTLSGRSMMTNKLVNPQASGISRFLVAAEDMMNTIDTKEVTQAELEHIELAIAQAMGIGIDKLKPESALTELRNKYVHIVKGPEGLTLKWGKNERLQGLVNDAEFNLGSVREMNGVLFENTDPSAVSQLHDDSKTLLHVVQAVELLRKIRAGDETIITNLALEGDGITNGMAFTLMQMGWTKFTEGMLGRAGVYGGDSNIASHGEFKENKGKDIYEAPLKILNTLLDKKAHAQIDDVIGGAWRNFMKNPVMIFIYGAGLKNITEAMAQSLIVGNSYIPGGLARGKLETLLEISGLKDIKPTYVKYAIKDGELISTKLNEDELNDDEKKLYAYLSEYQVGLLTKAIDEKLGDLFAESFKSTFGPVIEFRKALQTVEEVNYTIFKMNFNKKVKDKLAGRETSVKGVMGELTIAELTDIKSEMLSEGTYYATEAAIEGGLVDYWKTENKEGESNQISVTINTSTFQSGTGYSRNYNQAIKELVANVGAIGVTTVHAADGSVMITGHVMAVLNIYDALMMGTDLTKNTKQLQKMNESFYDINMTHSMLGKAVEKMEFMLGKREGLEMDPEMASQVLGDLERILGPVEEGESVLDLVGDVIHTLRSIDTARRDLVEQELVVNQYAAAGDIKGYEAKGKTTEELVDKRYAVFAEEGADTAVLEGLEWLVDSVRAGIVQEVATEAPVKQDGAKMAKEIRALAIDLFTSGDKGPRKIMEQVASEMTGTTIGKTLFKDMFENLKEGC